jgi:hypothetical protein
VVALERFYAGSACADGGDAFCGGNSGGGGGDIGDLVLDCGLSGGSTQGIGLLRKEEWSRNVQKRAVLLDLEGRFG